MNKNTLKIALCGFALSTSLTTFGAFAATVYPPEGGIWNYGVGVLGSYSDYKNDQYYHGSTVNHNGTIYASRNATPGSWSQALAPNIYTGCSFYYNL